MDQVGSFMDHGKDAYRWEKLGTGVCLVNGTNGGHTAEHQRLREVSACLSRVR